MKTPVYKRMRNPITPPKAKPLNRPRIKVKKWREIADKMEERLYAFSYSMSEINQRHGHRNLAYIREWIEHAESILNQDKTEKPFLSTYLGPWKGTSTDPHHVHPVIKMEDFV